MLEVFFRREKHVSEKIDKTGLECSYLLYLPKEYEQKGLRPLILFLHGKTDHTFKKLIDCQCGLPEMIENFDDTISEFIIIAPLCPEGKSWDTEDQIGILDALLVHIGKKYKVAKDGICVTGFSMGGFGTWKLAIKYPQRFAAIAPISPADVKDPPDWNIGTSEAIVKLCGLPVRIFYGEKENQLIKSCADKMKKELDKCRTDPGSTVVDLKICPGLKHAQVRKEVYNNLKLHKWFYQQLEKRQLRR